MTLLALEVSGQGQEGRRKLSRPPRLRRGLGSSGTAVAPRSTWGTGETGSSPAPREWGGSRGPRRSPGLLVSAQRQGWSNPEKHPPAALGAVSRRAEGFLLCFFDSHSVGSEFRLPEPFFFFLITKSPRSLLQLASYTASQPYNTQHGK